MEKDEYSVTKMKLGIDGKSILKSYLMRKMRGEFLEKVLQMREKHHKLKDKK